jgi:hypothetical protein
VQSPELAFWVGEFLGYTVVWDTSFIRVLSMNHVQNGEVILCLRQRRGLSQLGVFRCIVRFAKMFGAVVMRCRRVSSVNAHVIQGTTRFCATPLAFCSM